MPAPLAFIQNNAPHLRPASVPSSPVTAPVATNATAPTTALLTAPPAGSARFTSAAARTSPTVARALLTKLQQPRDYRRMCRKANRERRATLRRVIRGWQQTIRAYGLDLRGCEIRGWRRLGIPRYDKTTPYTAAQKAAAAIFRSPPPDPRYWQNPIPVDQQHLDMYPEANKPGPRGLRSQE